jgi:hypothetical protein
VSGDFQIEVFEIVLARPAHHYLFQHSQTKLSILRWNLRTLKADRDDATTATTFDLRAANE